MQIQYSRRFFLFLNKKNKKEDINEKGSTEGIEFIYKKDKENN